MTCANCRSSYHGPEPFSERKSELQINSDFDPISIGGQPRESGNRTCSFDASVAQRVTRFHAMTSQELVGTHRPLTRRLNAIQAYVAAPRGHD